MMRHWREREFERRLSPAPVRYGLGFWAFFASRPTLYRLATDLAARAMHLAGRGKGRFAWLPLRRRLDPLSRPRRAGGRDLPEPVAGQERSGAMSAREAIFANIRRSLGVHGDEAPRRFEVETRLAAGARRRRPAARPGRPRRPGSATFKAEAERAQASVAEVADWADAPAEVARFLRDNNCPATLRMGADPRLAAMPWSETALEILHGASDGRDVNAVSAAFAGIAETGTLALVSGADNPTTLNFLPDNHIVVLPRETIVADYESVFARLRGGLRQGRRAAHGQFHHRPVALGRHRADAAARRAWAAPAAYRDRRLSSAAAARRAVSNPTVVPQRDIFLRGCSKSP